MGQATLDLPDPLDAATVGASPSADDLLSQLAGDEIDRMLASNDVDRNPGAGADTAPRATQINHVEEPATDVARQSAIAATPNVDPDINAQLDALFDDLTSPKSEQPAPAEDQSTPPDPIAETATDPAAAIIAASTTALQQALQPAPSSASLAPTVAQEDLDTLAERAALTAPLPEPEPEADPRTQIQSSLAEAEAHYHQNKLPFYLRPLEWINAPFAALPDPLRETLGKIGLLTLFNAAAVLAYVLIFRRHKH